LPPAANPVRPLPRSKDMRQRLVSLQGRRGTRALIAFARAGYSILPSPRIGTWARTASVNLARSLAMCHYLAYGYGRAPDVMCPTDVKFLPPCDAGDDGQGPSPPPMAAITVVASKRRRGTAAIARADDSNGLDRRHGDHPMRYLAWDWPRATTRSTNLRLVKAS
jgi:hypothetical protein